MAIGPLAGLLIILFMIFMVMAPILVRVAERHSFDLAAHVLSWIGYVWMGALLLFFLRGHPLRPLSFLPVGGGWVTQKISRISSLPIGFRSTFPLFCRSSFVSMGTLKH